MIQKNILLLLIITSSYSAHAAQMPAHIRLQEFFEQTLGCTTTPQDCMHILACKDRLSSEHTIEPKQLLDGLKQAYEIIKKHAENEFHEAAEHPLMEHLTTLIDELGEDSDFAREIQNYDDFDELDVDSSADDAVTRWRKKNKTFKNICVCRNAKIRGNLCVAGQALFKSGIAFASTGALTITVPLNVSTVDGISASFGSADVTNVTLHNVFGLHQTANGGNAPAAAIPVGSYIVSYNPTTHQLFFTTP